MNPKVEITSLSITKLHDEQKRFAKYDIEASIDEVENTETEVKLKYKFVLLSNPVNSKISTEGFATIYGDQSEISKFLSPDERNIPLVVNNIYQEVFPLFYIISKSMQIPCPAYRLSQISTSSQVNAQPDSESIKDSTLEKTIGEIASPPSVTQGGEIEIKQSPMVEQFVTE